MFYPRYYKADASTYVIRSVDGDIRAQGKGLSFFYNAYKSSIAAVPINAQDASFIFNLQTGDFQEIAVQGQITYQITEPLKAAEVLNFAVATTGRKTGYVSEDPLRLHERVIRAAQALVQDRIEGKRLREALTMTNELTTAIREVLSSHEAIAALGLAILDVTVLKIAPTPGNRTSAGGADAGGDIAGRGRCNLRAAQVRGGAGAHDSRGGARHGSLGAGKGAGNRRGSRRKRA